MLLYTPQTISPQINLAAEEYLLTTAAEEVVMLWRNRPSVIIGRNQNAYAEVNSAFADSHGIEVVRRLSGGGAVFHDLGNLNYSYIIPSGAGGGAAALDFGRFCRPVTEALRSWGIDAGLSGRNDITVGDRKISGSAQCVFHGALLHHGTLLFDADISRMEGALRVDADKMRSKGIASVRSRVANISELLPSLPGVEGKPDIGAFTSALAGWFIASGARHEVFDEADNTAIRKLADSKYSTWEWNYGRSKEYANVCRRRFPFGTVEISFTSDGGVIREATVSGDFFGVRPSEGLASALVGAALTGQSIKNAAREVSEYISGSTPDDIASLILNI